MGGCSSAAVGCVFLLRAPRWLLLQSVHPSEVLPIFLGLRHVRQHGAFEPLWLACWLGRWRLAFQPGERAETDGRCARQCLHRGAQCGAGGEPSASTGGLGQRHWIARSSAGVGCLVLLRAPRWLFLQWTHASEMLPCWSRL